MLLVRYIWDYDKGTATERLHLTLNNLDIKDDEVNKLRDLLFIFKDKNIDYFKYYEL